MIFMVEYTRRGRQVLNLLLHNFADVSIFHYLCQTFGQDKKLTYCKNSYRNPYERNR